MIFPPEDSTLDCGSLSVGRIHGSLYQGPLGFINNELFLCYCHSAWIVPTFKPHTQARYRARVSDFSRPSFHLWLEAGASSLSTPPVGGRRFFFFNFINPAPPPCRSTPGEEGSGGTGVGKIRFTSCLVESSRGGLRGPYPFTS